MLTAIEARIAGILSEVGQIDPQLMQAQTSLESLGLDSIVMVEVIFAVEEAFDIAIPVTTEAAAMRLSDFAALVAELDHARA